MNTLWPVHTMELKERSTGKCNNVGDFQIIMLSERSQAGESMYCMTACICEFLEQAKP